MSVFLADCPKCPNVAETRPQVKELFGWRIMANEIVRPQSNCKRCRAKIQRQRKRLGLQISRT